MIELESVDVYWSSYRIPAVALDPHISARARVYLSKDLFFQDVMSSFRNHSDLVRQVEMDVPRMNVWLNGLRCVDARPLFDDAKAASLLPACTQAVMGLPVQMMHSHDAFVAECAPATPLRVYLSTDGKEVGFSAYKRLRILQNDMVVLVRIHADDSGVMVDYVVS